MKQDSLTLLRRAFLVFVMMILLLLVGAVLIPVDKRIRMTGVVSSQDQVTPIYAKNTGIVTQVYVKKNQQVIAHQTRLASLDPHSVPIALAHLQFQMLRLHYESLRIQAIIEEHDFSFDELLNRALAIMRLSLVNKADVVADSATLDKLITALRKQNQASTWVQLQRKNKSLKKRETQLIETRHIIEKHLYLLKKEARIVEKSRAVSKRDYYKVLKQMNQAQGEYDKLKHTLATLTSQQKQNENKILTQRGRIKQSAGQRLQANEKQLTQLEKEWRAMQKTPQHDFILAPKSGMISALYMQVGHMIHANSKLLMLSTPADKFYVKLKILPRSSASLKRGDIAQLSLYNHAYFWPQHWKGRIVSISKKLQQMPNGLPYFPGKLSLDSSSTKPLGGHIVLSNGVKVKVEVTLGQESLFALLLANIDGEH